MNQILLTDYDNNKKKNSNKNSNKDYNKNNSGDIKKIIMFFSVVILVFGIAIGGVYGYRAFKNSKGQEEIISKPTVSLQTAEEGAEEVIVIAEAKAGISKIIYSWNDEEQVVKELNGRTKQEEPIEIPFGENTLKVKVVDQNGEEIETTETFTHEEPVVENSDKIEINTSIVDNKLKITAKSELPIAYVTYRWNEEQETKIDAQNEEDTTIETIIDVKRGNNKLVIIAKDIEGNSNTIDKNFDGRLKPEINVYREANKLYMNISHDMGFERIEFYINGIVYSYDENFADYDPEKENVEFDLNLKEGENIVIIRAISREKTEEIYTGKCDYITE